MVGFFKTCHSDHRFLQRPLQEGRAHLQRVRCIFYKMVGFKLMGIFLPRRRLPWENRPQAAPPQSVVEYPIIGCLVGVDAEGCVILSDRPKMHQVSSV